MKDVELQQCYARMEQVCVFLLLGLDKYIFLRENHQVKNLKQTGNDQVNLNNDVKMNEEFEKKFVINHLIDFEDSFFPSSFVERT